jgi:hypothetical protein
MVEKKHNAFTGDRRKELRQRLAAKKNGKNGHDGFKGMRLTFFPEPELLDRLIEKVRQL